VPLASRSPNRLVRLSTGVVAALVLAATLALPVAADGDGGRLRDGWVSSERGTTATTFTFEVTYRDRGGDPAVVRVHLPAGSQVMTAQGSDWPSGVRFQWSSTLPAGRHRIAFSAAEGDRIVDRADGPVVTVEAAQPTPSPSPSPTAPPSPPPSPSPIPTRAPTPPASTPPTPTVAPTATPSASPAPTRSPAPISTPSPSGLTSGPTAGPGAAPTPTPLAIGGSPLTAQPSGSPMRPPVPTPSGSAGPSAGADSAGGVAQPSPSASTRATATPSLPPGPESSPFSTEDPAGGETRASDSSSRGPRSALGSWGDPTGVLEALGLHPKRSLEIRLLPAVVASTGGMTMLMAFMFFGKRRRDGEPTAPDEVLEAAAARAETVAADASLTAPPPVLEGDMAMPRWRRPSLLEARKAYPMRDAAPIVPMSFADGVAVDDALERRFIRYHAVELMETPDELRSASIGSLTNGDEVQLLERSGTYWRVLCPNGQQGWIHRMTLGEVVGAVPPPSPVETWAAGTLASDRPDATLLDAFIAARRSA
jgi:hypothetical protein